MPCGMTASVMFQHSAIVWGQQAVSVIFLMQVLNSFLEKHSTSNGPFLLDEYSFAECSAAPFIHNTKLVLSEFKKMDLLQLAKDQGCDRLSQWIEVRQCMPPLCPASHGSATMLQH